MMRWTTSGNDDQHEDCGGVTGTRAGDRRARARHGLLLHVQQHLIGGRAPDAAVTVGGRQDISASLCLGTTLVREVSG
jgi:hypothetical protein